MTNSIKSLKFIYILVAITVVVVSVLVRTYFSNKELNQVLTKKIDNLELQIQMGFQEHLNHLDTEFVLLTRSYEKNPQIMHNIIHDNRLALYKQIKDDYKYLKEKNRYLHPMHFIDAKNITILRMHKPQSFDDDLTNIRPIVKYVNETQKIESGFEAGKNGISYRITFPLRAKRKHVAILEYGVKPAFLADALLKDSFDVQAQILVKTQKLRHIVSKKYWKTLGEYSIIEASPLFEQVKSQLDLSQGHQFINANGKNFMVLNELNLKSFKGEVLAKVIIAQDITKFMQEHQQKLYDTYTSDLILIVFISLIVFILFNQYTVKTQSLQNEIREKDTQLIQQSRLASIGEMISMIAHQWRQPLSVVSTIAMNLKFKIMLDNCDLNKKEDREQTIGELDNIDSVLQNLSATINNFRDFYQPDAKPEKLNLCTTVEHALSIIGNVLIENNITVNYENHSDKEYLVFKNNMTQVILSIIKNAKDVFSQKQIQNPHLDIVIKENTISISDNAGGLNEELLEKIFDPYFSTKEDKNKTGLGLYMSKLIVEEHHHGSLVVKRLDEGLSFIITVKE